MPAQGGPRRFAYRRLTGSQAGLSLDDPAHGSMLSPLTYWILLAAVSAYAYARGRNDERWAAAICILATIGTRLVHSPYGNRFTHVEVGVMMVDVLAFAGFTAIALRSDRFWPLWVAGLQLTTTLAHLIKAAQFDLIPQVYAVAARFWVYPIFLIIVIGTWRSHRRGRLQDSKAPYPS